jgi:drug/metabolite transporter (DMT)-like permease
MPFLQDSGREIVDFFAVVSQQWTAGTLSSSSIQLALGATLWTGLISTAYTTYAQSFGQRRNVSPTNANLIYSLQPIATALFAYCLLGETMGPFGIVGGTLIGGAVLVAASQSFATTPSTLTTTTTATTTAPLPDDEGRSSPM